MNINTRLAVIASNFSGNGRQFITTNDVAWLLDTVDAQQKEIERLKVIEQAYEAYKSAH